MNKATIEILIDSLVICRYISLYAKFEKNIKEIFSHSLLEKDHKIRSKLFFYFGCSVGKKVYIDYDNNLVKMDNLLFKDEELFNDLNMNQMIRIDKKEHLIDIFDFNISSVMNRNLEYTFHDCCIKLIKMRNILAHELDDLEFKEADVIETFSNTYIEKNKKEWLDSFDIGSMKQSAICVYSNFSIMEMILEKIKTREGK